MKNKWVIPVTNAFQEILKESNRKPNKILVDKGLKFYNRSMKSFLQNNNIDINSTHNEEKSIISERFIKILKNKMYKYMTSMSKNVYIDKLDEIVNKYNNTYHRTIKMKPVDVNPSMYIDFDKENNKEGPKFKVGDHVKISEYKNIFSKGYVTNWSKEVFVIIKNKNIVPWTYVISDLKGEEIVGTFYEKELQKKIKKSLELKK